MEAEAFEMGDVYREKGERVPPLMDRTRPQRATHHLAYLGAVSVLAARSHIAITLSVPPRSRILTDNAF